MSAVLYSRVGYKINHWLQQQNYFKNNYMFRKRIICFFGLLVAILTFRTVVFGFFTSKEFFTHNMILTDSIYIGFYISEIALVSLLVISLRFTVFASAQYEIPVDPVDPEISDNTDSEGEQFRQILEQRKAVFEQFAHQSQPLNQVHFSQEVNKAH